MNRVFSTIIVGVIAAVGAVQSAAQDRGTVVPSASPGSQLKHIGALTHTVVASQTVTTTPNGFVVWHQEVNSGCSFGDHNVTLDIPVEPVEMSSISVTMTTFDVDYNDPQGCPGGPEVDAVSFNGHSLGILTGANDSWSINSFSLSPSQVVKGTNQIFIDTDAPGTGCWCVGLGYVEVRAKVGFKVTTFTPQADDRNRDFHAGSSGIALTFSGEYDPATLDASTFRLEYRNQGGTYTPVPGSFTQLEPNKARFVPSSDLKGGVRYRATLKSGSAGVKSKIGAVLSDDTLWYFWTVPQLDSSDRFDYGAGSTCPPSSSPCSGLELAAFQVARNKSLVPNKPAVGRLYVRWKKHDDVFADDQVTQLDLDAAMNLGGTTISLRQAVKRPDRSTSGERQLALNTVNFYHTPTNAFSYAVTVTPTPQTNEVPVKFTTSLNLGSAGASPSINFDYYFLKDGAWSGGIPAPAKSEGVALLTAGSQLITDEFPVLGTTFNQKGEYSIGYTVTGNSIPDNSCGTVKEVECPYWLFFSSKKAEYLCTYEKLETMRGGKKFVAATVPNGLCNGATAFAIGGKVFMHQSGAGGNDGTVAHETGHIYGISSANSPSPGHRNSSVGVEGFQVRARVNRSHVENPAQAISLMHDTVQGTGTQWIDNDDYAALFGRVHSLGNANALIAATAAGPQIIVSGYLNTTAGSIEILPAFLQEVPNDPPSPSGTCTVELLDGGNSVISSSHVTPGVEIIAVASTEEKGVQPLAASGPQYFTTSLDWLAAAQKIRVTCGSIAATTTRSPHGPSVTFVDPPEGATLSNLHTITWTGTDADDPAGLAYQAQFSNDGGASWTPLMPLNAGTSYPLATTLLSSGAAKLRIMVTDGFNTAYATRSVTIQNSVTVLGVSPSGGATGVPVAQPVTAVFVTRLDPGTINDHVVLLQNVTTSTYTTGSVVYDDVSRALTFRPSVPLQANTQYTASIDGSIRDLSGNSPSSYSWSFTTGADTTAPTVIHRNPAPTEVGVPLNPIITARFSEPMDAGSINTTSFQLLVGSVPVTATISYAGPTRQAILIPAAPLSTGTTYTVRIVKAAADVAGNGLEDNDTWTFTTGSALNPSPIRIIGNYADQGIDTTGDGKYENLTVFADVEVRAAGTYNLNGRLVDKFETLIEWQSSGGVSLGQGVHTLALVFSGTNIRSNGVNGPYTLDALSFYDTASPAQSDVKFSPYETFAYDVGSFYAIMTLGGLPSQLLEVNTTRPNAFNLRTYTTHIARPLTDVTYNILINTNPTLGISIDSDANVDIVPPAGAKGDSDVTVEARDPAGNRALATFRVIVQTAQASALTPTFTTTMHAGQTQTISVTIQDQFGRLFAQPIAVAFATTTGNVAPPSVTTATGTAATTYTAPASTGIAFVTITAGTATDTISITIDAAKGDANGDGKITVNDAIYLINFLFQGGPAPAGDADANHDGVTDTKDVIYLINYLFSGGPPPS